MSFDDSAAGREGAGLVDVPAVVGLEAVVGLTATDGVTEGAGTDAAGLVEVRPLGNTDCDAGALLSRVG